MITVTRGKVRHSHPVWALGVSARVLLAERKNCRLKQTDRGPQGTALASHSGGEGESMVASVGIRLKIEEVSSSLLQFTRPRRQIGYKLDDTIVDLAVIAGDAELAILDVRVIGMNARRSLLDNVRAGSPRRFGRFKVPTFEATFCPLGDDSSLSTSPFGLRHTHRLDAVFEKKFDGRAVERLGQSALGTGKNVGKAGNNGSDSVVNGGRQVGIDLDGEHIEGLALNVARQLVVLQPPSERLFPQATLQP